MTLDRRALIVSGLAASGVVTWASPLAARAAPLPALPGDMVLGSPKAKVQFVMYASASCPHCAHWWTTVQPEVRKTFIDPGKVRLVFREFLTPPEEFAAAGFMLARRVPGKYFEVLTTVFQKQEEIYRSEQLYEGLEAIGKQYGLTADQFKAAMADETALKAVNARSAKAIDDGVEVTPTFFVNGAPIQGEANLAALSKAFATAAKG